MLKKIINDEKTVIYVVGRSKEPEIYNEKELEYKTNEKYLRLEFMRDFSAFRDIDILSKDHKVILNVKTQNPVKEIYMVFMMNELKESNINIISDLLKDSKFMIRFEEIISEETNSSEIIKPVLTNLLTNN